MKTTPLNWPSAVFTAVAAIVFNSSLPTTIFAQEKSIGATYRSREPRTCEDTKAPAKGAITAALALKYLSCQMDYVSGSNLYLVENVKVEVGGGMPYAALIGHRSFPEVDVKSPVYPIRGSLLLYQCQRVTGEYYSASAGENCATYSSPKATGYCYRTTFGDWRCYMSDPAAHSDDNIRHKVAPPKG